MASTVQYVTIPVRQPNPRLTAAQRRKLPASRFAMPQEHKYPLDTPGRTKNALTRLNQMYDKGYVTAKDYKPAYIRIMQGYRRFGLTTHTPPRVPVPRLVHTGPGAAMERSARQRMAAANPARAPAGPLGREDTYRRMMTRVVTSELKDGKVYFGERHDGRPLSVGPYHPATGPAGYAIFTGNVPSRMRSASDAAAHFMALAKPGSVRRSGSPEARRQNPRDWKPKGLRQLIDEVAEYRVMDEADREGWLEGNVYDARVGEALRREKAELRKTPEKQVSREWDEWERIHWRRQGAAAPNPRGSVPATVERYQQEHVAQGRPPAYAWALAWSRYCKHKRPGSPRCHQKEYFHGRGPQRNPRKRDWVDAHGMTVVPDREISGTFGKNFLFRPIRRHYTILAVEDPVSRKLLGWADVRRMGYADVRTWALATGYATPQRNPARALPKAYIEWAVGNLHVGTPDEEVRAQFEDKCRQAGYTDAQARKCGELAVKQHHKNMDLYRAVMGGHSGRLPRSSRGKSPCGAKRNPTVCACEQLPSAQPVRGLLPACNPRRGTRGDLAEMRKLLSQHGYDPKDAKKLLDEGMGPWELENRLRIGPPGAVGSPEYTHGLRRVSSRNPSKTITHVTGKGGRYYVLHHGGTGTRWLQTTKGDYEKILAEGGVRVPWAHGKLAHHKSTYTMSNAELGVAMHHWHSGQGDPIYAVGSTLYADKATSRELMEDAINELNHVLHTGKHSAADRKELNEIIGNLEQRLAYSDPESARLQHAQLNPKQTTSSDRTIARVELYNRVSRKGHVVGNGYYVGRYTIDGRRMGTLKDFGADQAGAHRYADLWNGPRETSEGDRVARRNPARSPGGAKPPRRVTMSQAGKWLQSHGFVPEPGSSRWVDAKGNIGRIEDRPGDDVWDVTVETRVANPRPLQLPAATITATQILLEQGDAGPQKVKLSGPNKWAEASSVLSGWADKAPVSRRLPRARFSVEYNDGTTHQGHVALKRGERVDLGKGISASLAKSERQRPPEPARFMLQDG